MLPVLCATSVPAGRPAGNRVLELLALEDRDHLRVRRGIHRLSLRQLVEKDLKTSRGRAVIEALVEGLAVLDATQHLHAIGAQPRHRAPDVLDTQLFNQQVRREVTAHGDHRFAELPQGQRLAHGGVDLLVRVVTFAQRVRAAVDDALELVADVQRVVERDRAGAQPAGRARSSPAPSSCSPRETPCQDRSAAPSVRRACGRRQRLQRRWRR